MNVLYLSYDGMTDPLGQAQVIPYLQELSSKHGHTYTLISFEKKERYDLHSEKVKALLEPYNITWKPEFYTKKPPVLSTLFDIYVMHKQSILYHKKRKFDLIHARSYISSLIALTLKKSLKIPFLFEMRGFWADERVDGGLWKLDSPIFSRIYKYFKNKEKEYLQNANYVISLTHNAENEIHSWDGMQNVPIQVIPCCVNTSQFSVDKLDENTVNSYKSKLGITDSNSPIISYVGSLGTWYMLDEMLDFFIVLQKKYTNAKFLFITPDAPELIYSAASKKGIAKENFIITSAQREEVPTLVSLCDASIFFIKQAFSKKASSPTKQGELMSMGVPLICNAGVGDTDFVVKKYEAGMVIENFTQEAYQKVVDNFDNILKMDKSKLVFGANDFYSLEKGVEKYASVYKKISEGN